MKPYINSADLEQDKWDDIIESLLQHHTCKV